MMAIVSAFVHVLRVVITFLFAGISFSHCEAVVPYKTLYFEQLVDHFNYVNQQTFQQRYLVAGKPLINSKVSCYN